MEVKEAFESGLYTYLSKPSAVAFGPGQKIKFPEPMEGVFYFDSIRYEQGEPVIRVFTEDDEAREIKGYDLWDISHV